MNAVLQKLPDASLQEMCQTQPVAWWKFRIMGGCIHTSFAKEAFLTPRLLSPVLPLEQKDSEEGMVRDFQSPIEILT